MTKATMRAGILRALLIFAGLLVAFFLAVVIAFAAAAAPTSTLCGGRLVVVDTRTGATISLVYRLVVAILAFVVAAGFLIAGGNVYRSLLSGSALSQGDAAAHKERQGMMRTIFLMAVGCSLSLLIEAVFFVIIVAVPNYHNNILSMSSPPPPHSARPTSPLTSPQ